mmetsp:Transcript_9358/g.11745  ORF Transcript_9358/g.11745 Transcript_9358/m.11745 type:complete len:208 (-) Transcript_9358:45-668(-)
MASLPLPLLRLLMPSALKQSQQLRRAHQRKLHQLLLASARNYEEEKMTHWLHLKYNCYRFHNCHILHFLHYYFHCMILHCYLMILHFQMIHHLIHYFLMTTMTLRHSTSHLHHHFHYSTSHLHLHLHYSTSHLRYLMSRRCRSLHTISLHHYPMSYHRYWMSLLPIHCCLLHHLRLLMNFLLHWMNLHLMTPHWRIRHYLLMSYLLH